MLYCKKCQKEVVESETELGQKIGDIERWPDDGINQKPNEKMFFPVRVHINCGGEVIDQDSIDGVKKVLHPES